MNVINGIMATFPAMEVAIRVIYMRTKNNKGIKALAKKMKEKEGDVLDQIKSWENYRHYIEGLGIKHGDILIVHSSMDGLSGMDIDKKSIMSFLLELVGENGTLVMPAFPLYKENDVAIEFHEKEEPKKLFNPAFTPAWTGILPNYMCGLNGAIRSMFPYNTVVAIGKEAFAMTKDNLKGRVPHGKYSAWEYCNAHHAKVLFMGVDPVHSLTEIHLCEDLMYQDWPVKGWYKNQNYTVKDNDKNIEVNILERKKFWCQYLTENYCIKKLVEGHVLMVQEVEDTPVGYISDLFRMTEFVTDSVQNKRDMLFYKIPRKYWK